MKVFASAAALLFATGASANVFAPKVTKNTAKANYVGSLMRGAKTLRKLEENADAEVDLSGYSVKFEKCQFVKQYNGGNGNNNNNNNNNKDGAIDTILATKRFVIFRLCPSNSCSSCNYNYGEYIVDMDAYLEATLEYKQQAQENYCQACEECVQNNADDNADENADDNADENANENANMCANVDTSTCYDECQNIDNMEANGYVDASEYTGCVKLSENENNGRVYYAGAMCASSGSRIKIGVFYDQYCSIYDESAEIENFMVDGDGVSMKLSYHLLKQTFAEGECVASCLKEDENGNNNDNNNDNNQAAEVNEVCTNLYEDAGKCESSHGFVGIVNYDDYDNQVAQEELVCDFIATVKAGSYDSTGEIVVTGGRSMLSGGTSTTGGQKFALTFFVLGSVGLAGYAAMLHQQLTKGAKADLARQGGAMA